MKSFVTFIALSLLASMCQGAAEVTVSTNAATAGVLRWPTNFLSANGIDTVAAATNREAAIVAAIPSTNGFVLADVTNGVDTVVARMAADLLGSNGVPDTVGAILTTGNVATATSADHISSTNTGFGTTFNVDRYGVYYDAYLYLIDWENRQLYNIFYEASLDWGLHQLLGDWSITGVLTGDGSGLSNLTATAAYTSAWAVAYSDGTTNKQELQVGAAGSYLRSGGIGAAPSWGVISATATNVALSNLVDVTTNTWMPVGDGAHMVMRDPAYVRTNLSLVAGSNVMAYGTNFVYDTNLLANILTVDGSGSGIDADTVDGLQASAFFLVSGAAPMTGHGNAGGYRWTNVANAVGAQDAATLAQVQSATSTLVTASITNGLTTTVALNAATSTLQNALQTTNIAEAVVASFASTGIVANAVTNGGCTINGAAVSNGAAITVTATITNLPPGTLVSTNTGGANQFFRYSSGDVTGVITGAFASATGTGDFLSDGTIPMTGNLNFGNQRGTNLAAGVANADAVNMAQLISATNEVLTYVAAHAGTDGAAVTGIVGNVLSTGTVYNANRLGGELAAVYVTNGQSGVTLGNLTASDIITFGGVSRTNWYTASGIATATTSRAFGATGNWTDISMSTNGQWIGAIDLRWNGSSFAGSDAYVTSDAGTNTFAVGPNPAYPSYYGISCSDSGQNVFLAVFNYAAGVYISSNYGLTYTAKTPGAATRHAKVVSDSTGSKLISFCPQGNSLYRSINAGTNWTLKTGTMLYRGCSSANGKYIAGGMGNPFVYDSHRGYLYTSSDGGTNFTQRDSTLRLWRGMACDASGQYLVGSTWTNYIYISSDYGANWAPRVSKKAWGMTAMAKTGGTCWAVASNDYVYISGDYGTNWSAVTDLGVKAWSVVACDATGRKAVIGAYGSALQYIEYNAPINGSIPYADSAGVATLAATATYATTAGSATTLVGVVTANITTNNASTIDSGTLADARIATTIARDSEVSTATNAAIIDATQRVAAVGYLLPASTSTLATVTQLNTATNAAIDDATQRVAAVGYLLPASTSALATAASVVTATQTIAGASVSGAVPSATWAETAANSTNLMGVSGANYITNMQPNVELAGELTVRDFDVYGRTTIRSNIIIRMNATSDLYGAISYFDQQGLWLHNSNNGVEKPIGLIFGGWMSSVYGGIYGVMTNEVGQTQGDIRFCFRTNTTDLSHIERVRMNGEELRVSSALTVLGGGNVVTNGQTVTNALQLGGIAAGSYVTGGVFSVGTVVSNVVGTLYFPTNGLGGGTGGGDWWTNQPTTAVTAVTNTKPAGVALLASGDGTNLYWQSTTSNSWVGFLAAGANGVLTVAGSGVGTLVWGSELYDSGSLYDPATGTFSPAANGWFEVWASVECTGITDVPTGNITIQLLVNGAESTAVPGRYMVTYTTESAYEIMPARTTFFLYAGSNYTIVVYNGNSSNRTFRTGQARTQCGMRAL